LKVSNAVGYRGRYSKQQQDVRNSIASLEGYMRLEDVDLAVTFNVFRYSRRGWKSTNGRRFWMGIEDYS
jgi:hypothetical protein